MCWIKSKNSAYFFDSMKYCFEVKNKWVKFSNNDKYKRNKVNLYKKYENGIHAEKYDLY